MLKFIISRFAKLLLSDEWLDLYEQIGTIRATLLEHPDLMPPIVAQQLLVSGEDRRHSRHPGYDIRAIARAIFRRCTSSRREGGSTIEQQLVRVITRRFERSLGRKLREILLASLVAENFSKAETPMLYLTVGYYGWHMNNYAQACRRLGFSPNRLSLDAAAGLVARLKYPEPRSVPINRVEQITRRKEYLKKLYYRHSLDGTYLHLGVRESDTTIFNRGAVTEILGTAPYV